MSRECVGRYVRKSIVSILVLALSFQSVHAVCEEVSGGKYPGWWERFNGSVGLGNSTSFENFDVKLVNIYGTSAIKIDVFRDSNEYLSTSVEAGAKGRLKESDIMVELYSANTTSQTANFSIYTPQKSNLTLNLTNLDILESVSGRIQLMPGEEFRADFTLNNTGELEARDIFITPIFGDFEILYTDLKNTSSLCPGSLYDFTFTLKTPELRKVFNYTLYLKLEYWDENIQLQQVNYHTEYYPQGVNVTPIEIRVEKSVSNSTLLNTGREVKVRVHLNNTGSFKAYNVEWSDSIPPDVVVTRGTTSWKGSLVENGVREFSYWTISDDPIVCSSLSQVFYQDRLKNNYTSFSNNETIRFSPFISIQKNIDGIPWYVDPTKNVMGPTTTWELDSGAWWLNGTENKITNSPGKIWINRTAQVQVKIKNRGNALARGLYVREELDGLRATGNTSWRGNLKPDEEVSYEYTAEVIKHGNLTLVTNVTYFDVDLGSFVPPVEFGEEYQRYCTKIRRAVNYETRDDFYGLYHNVTINRSTGLKVLSDSEFDFNLSLDNKGSDPVHDVLIHIDTSALKAPGLKYGGEIVKGQPDYYIKELGAKYYPDDTIRPGNLSSVNYSLTLLAPGIEEDRNFTIYSIVEYKDFFGNAHVLNTTANLTVMKAKPAYVTVTLEKKDIAVTPGSPQELDVGDYGDAFLNLKSTGYSALENVTIKISLPSGIEVASNDTAWRGLIEAQLRRANETWYWFSGDITWNSSLGIREEQKLPLLIRGTRAGLYKIPFTIEYDGEELSSTIDVKIRGPILTITKSISEKEVEKTGLVNVTVRIKNVGEDIAGNVVVTDHVPANFEAMGSTTANIGELGAGEETTLKYILKALEEGSYRLDKAEVRWTDKMGNEYAESSEEIVLEVSKFGEGLKPPAEEEEIVLSKKQLVLALMFSVILVGLLLKILLISIPISKE